MAARLSSQPVLYIGEENAAEEKDRNLVSEIILGIGTQSWLVSFVVHCLIFIVLALVLGTIKVVQHVINTPSFESVQAAAATPEITHFEVGDTPLAPSELNTETLQLTEPHAVEAQFNDKSKFFEEAGGGRPVSELTIVGGVGAGFDVKSTDLGPLFSGDGGIEGGVGTGENAGQGGAGSGFGTRGTGERDAIDGHTKASERAVAAALFWLSRHQNRDGSWSLDHRACCKGGTCSGFGEIDADAGATALALLPFFAAGQTHQSKGPYQKHIEGGINWLIKNQKPNGDLSANTNPHNQMYTHGLAAIALCEAYGMTQDSRVGYAAQSAIDFIQTGQNADGAWRYQHSAADSDLSIAGWQIMALKSGQMANLKVNPDSMARAKRFLKLVTAGGNYNEQFGYRPGMGPTPSMTAVGLLMTQYLGAQRGDPVVIGGTEFLAKNLPNPEDRNTYYWYYATQVMHNVPGPEWDKWNRAMRKLLINTQDKRGCEAGSWDPVKPSIDPWGRQGGRLMVTSLSCLTLEVYYRYLPLYKFSQPPEDPKNVNKTAAAE